jgi:hypothetical protein
MKKRDDSKRLTEDDFITLFPHLGDYSLSGIYNTGKTLPFKIEMSNY